MVLGWQANGRSNFKKHIDPLPILISGVGVKQLLSIPKLTYGTGEAQATTIVACLQE